MRIYKYVTAIVALSLCVCVLFGCTAPAYMDPYGTGKQTPVTNQTIKTRIKDDKTVPFLSNITTTTPSTVTLTTTKLVVPEGYQRCPDCNGEKVVCAACYGTGQRKGEILDPKTGIVKRYYTTCGICSEEDPGYEYCETCKNKLILPIS